MSESYFDQDRMTPEFFQLIGEILVGWSALERCVDLTLSKSGIFHSEEGDAITAWSRKSKELRILYESKFSKKWVKETFDQLIDMAQVRHTIVHGYCLGLNASKPPRVKFVAAKFHSYATNHLEISPTAEEMRGFRNLIHKIDGELSLIMFSIISGPSKKSEKDD